MFGTPRFHHEVIDSTNILAKDLAIQGTGHGTLVTAGFQTAGRGRFQRVWHSEKGLNVLASYVVYPSRDMQDWGGLPLLCGCAVARVLAGAIPPSQAVTIKWPNDVLVSRRKIAGILVESGMGSGSPWAVLGIGININQREFLGDYLTPPTSLACELGEDGSMSISVDLVIARLSAELTNLFDAWEGQGNTPVINEWLSWSELPGAMIQVVQDGKVIEGKVLGLNQDCSLRLQTGNGAEVSVYAGDVTMRATEARN